MRLSKSTAAQKALDRAIDEATAELQAQLRQKDARIAQLTALLAKVVQIATLPAEAKAGEEPAPQPVVPPVDDVTVPQGDPIELAAGDNLGDGRWAP